MDQPYYKGLQHLMQIILTRAKCSMILATHLEGKYSNLLSLEVLRKRNECPMLKKINSRSLTQAQVTLIQ